MSRTRQNRQCNQCRSYISYYAPGTGWVCDHCGPRTPEQMGPVQPMTRIQLAAKSLGTRALIRSQLPEVETLGVSDPTEDRVMRIFDGATAQEHFAFLQYLLDIMQLKLAGETEDGWWVARKSYTDPSFTNPYAPQTTTIRGTDHVIHI